MAEKYKYMQIYVSLIDHMVPSCMYVVVYWYLALEDGKE